MKKDGWQRKATSIFSNHQNQSRRGWDVKVRWTRSKETLFCHKELAGRPKHPSKRRQETSAHCQWAGSYAAGGRESGKQSREKAEKDSAVFQEPIPLASQVKDTNLVWFLKSCRLKPFLSSSVPRARSSKTLVSGYKVGRCKSIYSSVG